MRERLVLRRLPNAPCFKRRDRIVDPIGRLDACGRIISRRKRCSLYIFRRHWTCSFYSLHCLGHLLVARSMKGTAGRKAPADGGNQIFFGSSTAGVCSDSVASGFESTGCTTGCAAGAFSGAAGASLGSVVMLGNFHARNAGSHSSGAAAEDYKGTITDRFKHSGADLGSAQPSPAPITCAARA